MSCVCTTGVVVKLTCRGQTGVVGAEPGLNVQLDVTARGGDWEGEVG